MSRSRSDSQAKQPPASKNPTVVCFGEVLWDCLPNGLFLGGAPINASYHLAKQGLNVIPVTAVGRDFLGDEAVRRISNWPVDSRYIGRNDHPTGTVGAKLDAAGVATYQIRRDVAWDYIPVPARLHRLGSPPAAIVFGTLALRGIANREGLQSLLDAWPETLRVVDLNFRPPFDTAAATRFALERAQLLKLNEDEMCKLTGEKGKAEGSLKRGAQRLARETRIPRICVTAGNRGAGLMWNGEWFWEAARPVDIRDTVGAGDSFLAALLGELLLKRSRPDKALARACRLGEFVASRDGATPNYRLDRQDRPIAE